MEDDPIFTLASALRFIGRDQPAGLGFGIARPSNKPIPHPDWEGWRVVQLTETGHPDNWCGVLIFESESLKGLKDHLAKHPEQVFLLEENRQECLKLLVMRNMRIAEGKQ